VLKAKNQKKINSHRWLFNAIGKMLNVSNLPHMLANRIKFLSTARNLRSYRCWY